MLAYTFLYHTQHTEVLCNRERLLTVFFVVFVGTVLPGEGEDAFVSDVEQLREVLKERMEMYNLELRACESMLTKE